MSRIFDISPSGQSHTESPQEKLYRAALQHFKLSDLKDSIEVLIPENDNGSRYRMVGFKRTDSTSGDNTITWGQIGLPSGKETEHPPIADRIEDLLRAKDCPPELRAAILNWQHPADPIQTGAGAGKITRIENVPDFESLPVRPVENLPERVSVKRGICLVTGDSGDGKTTISTRVAATCRDHGMRVLYLDRDNPQDMVRERLHRLNVTTCPMFKLWGGWCFDDPPPHLDDPRIEAWVRQPGGDPLIFVDSFGAFFNGDENNAASVRDYFRAARKLTYLGASIIVLHNDGKSEGARVWRGSQAFKDSIDVGFHVSNSPKGGRLDKLTLTYWKARGGLEPGAMILYRYDGGKMVRSGVPPAPNPSNDAVPQLTALLAAHPGVSGRQFTELAKAAGLGRNQAREFFRSNQK